MQFLRTIGLRHRSQPGHAREPELLLKHHAAELSRESDHTLQTLAVWAQQLRQPPLTIGTSRHA